MGYGEMAMRLARVIGIFVSVLTVTTFFAGLVISEASAGSQTHNSIGFESGWDPSWSANDYNSNSGLDYWGISTYRSFSGTHSVWCAEVGTSSVNGIANNVNHYYDQDMDAWLEIPIGDISAWSSATFSFYTWYVTGSWSLADYLRVLNSSDGTSWWVQWTQTQLSSSGWQQVSFSLSTTTTSVAFWFTSDPTVGWGPYEGVYIDDIVVTVTDSSIPVSSVGSLSSFQTTPSFSIPYTASDLGGSGLAYVELYYRPGISGAFALYTTSANPSGHWTASPIGFDSSAIGGDGTYQFYTRAMDTSGNQEAAPSIPDATTTVDTVAPSTAQGLTGTVGTSGWYQSSVLVTLVSSDATSGIASIVYRIDSGNWQTYSSNFLLSSEGTHALDFYSTDNAGNSEIEKSVSVKIDTVPPELSITSPSNDSIMPAPVSVMWHSSDPTSGITKQEYKFDDGIWFDATSFSPPYVVILPTTLGDGPHMIYVRVTDGAGNQALKSVNYTEDSTPPELTILYPLEGGYTSSKIVEWRATDNEAVVAPFRVNIDSIGWIFGEEGTSVYHLNVPDGPHSFQVEAVDTAGNSVVRMVNFTLDTTLPTVSVTGPQFGAHIRGDYVDVTWQSSDNIGIVLTEVKTDGMDWRPVTGYEAKHIWFGSGYHVVQIRVTDHAGNQAISTISFRNDNGAFSFGGPYYGLPTVAIIVGVILVGLFIALTLLKKRRSPTAPPLQPPAAPPSEPPPESP